MLVKDKFLEKTNLIILILSLCFSHNLYAEDIHEKIYNYNNTLKNSSANFIQTDNSDLQEGIIYFGNKRIKIIYGNPQNITIILSEKKGVYTNHQLKESEFFSTKKSYIKIFFEIFNNKKFLEKTIMTQSNNQIEISESVDLDNILYNIKLIYESSPIKLRRLEIIGNNNKVQMGFFDHKTRYEFDKKFFLMIDPYLN